MTDDPVEQEYQRDKLATATRILNVIDRRIDGEQAEELNFADLGWLRALLLDQIELAEAKLDLKHSQSRESILRTISLGLYGAHPEDGGPDGQTA